MTIRLHRTLLSGALAASLLISPVPTASAWATHTKIDAAWKEDSCKIVRQPMSDIRRQITSDTVTGAAVGALTMFLAAKAGHASTGTAVVAGLFGGVAGAVIGNIKAKRDAGLDRQSLNTYVDGEFGPRITPFQRLSNQILDLGNCRRGQLFTIQQDLAEGRADKELSTLRYQAVVKWLQEDDRLVNSLLQDQRGRVSAYAQSYAYANGSTEDQVKDPDTTLTSVASTSNASVAEQDFTVSEAGEAPPPPPPPPVEQRFVTAKTGAVLRAGASAKAKPIVQVPKGETVTVVPGSAAGSWLNVQWKGKTGFIYGEGLGTAAPAAQVATRQADPADVPAGKKGAKLIKLHPKTNAPAATQRVQLAIASQHDAQRAHAVDSGATRNASQSLLDQINAHG